MAWRSTIRVSNFKADSQYLKLKVQGMSHRRYAIVTAGFYRPSSNVLPQTREGETTFAQVKFLVCEYRVNV